jgi:glycosyltransferase involved in cell wall biosynthesis
LGVSVILPVFNSERTLKECLSSIELQEYPKDLLQIIIVDGGSTDSTLRIATHALNSTIVQNPRRTGEAGKAIGVQWAGNEILAFIDSDNVLSDKLWLRKMTKPFSDLSIVASEPLYYSHRRHDPVITRYCALIGANDPLTVYLGNHDRYCYFRRTWTGVPVEQKDCGEYLSVKLKGRILPTFGANGFLVRRDIVREFGATSFLFDVDLVQHLARAGNLSLAKVKIGVIHLFASSLGLFMRKTYRRARDYWFYSATGARSYPWTDQSRVKLLKFVLFSITFIPTAEDARRGYESAPDTAWFFHPFASFIVLWAYSVSLVTNMGTILRGRRARLQ